MTAYPHALFVSLLFTALLGCKPDDTVEPEPPPPATTGTLRVVIKPTWNGAPFVMNAEYRNVNDYRVKIEGVKFYLANIALQNGTSSSLARNIDVFDLAHNGDTVTWSGIQPGTWNGLHLGLGVPQALNDAEPSDYPNGHPLSVITHPDVWWSWAMGYKFVQIGGRFNVDGTSTTPLTSGFSMHTGRNACYQEFDLALADDVVITAGNTSTLVLGVAVDKFFYSATDTLHFPEESQEHGANLPLALEITANVVGSITAE